MPGHVQNVVDGFLLGALNKAAGVDDDHIGLYVLRGDLVAGHDQLVQHNLGVHLVFRTAKGNKSYLHDIAFPDGRPISLQFDFLT